MYINLLNMANAESRDSMIQIKRVYEQISKTDGKLFLVERLWPRGIKKETLEAAEWLKDVAPSTTLRKWFNHEIEKWEGFKEKYTQELDQNQDAWSPILEMAKKTTVTLLYSSHDTEHNNAKALKDYLESKL